MRDRAVRMGLNKLDKYESVAKGAKALAPKLNIGTETLRLSLPPRRKRDSEHASLHRRRAQRRRDVRRSSIVAAGIVGVEASNHRTPAANPSKLDPPRARRYVGSCSSANARSTVALETAVIRVVSPYETPVENRRRTFAQSSNLIAFHDGQLPCFQLALVALFPVGANTSSKIRSAHGASGSKGLGHIRSSPHLEEQASDADLDCLDDSASRANGHLVILREFRVIRGPRSAERSTTTTPR